MLRIFVVRLFFLLDVRAYYHLLMLIISVYILIYILHSTKKYKKSNTLFVSLYFLDFYEH